MEDLFATPILTGLSSRPHSTRMALHNPALRGGTARRLS
jgi:hypothetical protein